jgi:CspA family cold shock protein
MKEFVESIVRALVSSPEEVDIEEIEGGPNTKLLEIKVSKQDVRNLLGEGGRTIAALRRIVSAAGKGKSYYIIDVATENDSVSRRWSSKGKIRRLFEDRNYGFIEAEDGKTIYFHASSLEGAGIRSLSIYQPVHFEAVEGSTGLRAVRVVPMGDQGLLNL